MKLAGPEYESEHLIRAVGEEPNVLTFEPLLLLEHLRYALRAADCDAARGTAPDADAIESFIAQSFDETQGGFWGHGLLAARSAARNLGAVKSIVAERGALTAKDASAIGLLDPFEAAYALEALYARGELVRVPQAPVRRLDAMYSVAA